MLRTIIDTESIIVVLLNIFVSRPLRRSPARFIFEINIRKRLAGFFTTKRPPIRRRTKVAGSRAASLRLGQFSLNHAAKARACCRAVS
jgi:hypothetical protein